MLLIRTRAGQWRGSVLRGARRSSAAASLLSFVALACATGCLGDVTIDRIDRSDAGQSIETLAPVCIPGDVQCNGNWVERCVPSGSAEPPRWTKIEDCASEELCVEPGVCQAPVCAAREIRCSGAVSQRCRADRTGWEDLAACESAAHCSLDVQSCSAGGGDAPCCLDVPCQPGELRCNSSDLQRCRADQSDLDLVASCATAALCAASVESCVGDAGVCECVDAACAPGETRCEGTTLQRCNADRTGFEFVEECASSALCEQGQARAPLSCQPAACAAGSFDCTEQGTLRPCRADRTGFDAGQACPGGAAFCDAAQGVCTPTPCQPGQKVCDGADVLACRADQTGFEATGEVCATADLCLDDEAGNVSCLPPVCAENAVRCTGSQLQRCNAGRTDFNDVGPACLRDDLCSAERERCDYCFPSRRECTFDLVFSRTCAADGNSFGPSTFCPLGCIANTGACRTCDIGSYACQNGFLSRCDDGFSFDPLFRGSDCSGNTRVSCNGDNVQNTSCGALGCNPSRNTCNECLGQARICDGSDSFRACQPNGTFGPSTDCQDGLLCTGQGQCVCTPFAVSCNDDQVLICNSAGNAIVAGARCGGPGGNVLRTCDDGQLSADTCASAALCSSATGADCPACNDAELRCEADDLLVCAADRSGFEPAPACAGSTLRRCVAGELEQTVCDDAEACAAAVDGVCGAGSN